MKILIGCEESQAVTIELRKLGHEAYSCDLEPCSGGHPEWHFRCDIYDVLYLGWDAIGMHPSCTKLTVSGNATYAKGKPKHHERLEAAKWTEALWNECTRICDKVYFENPIGVLPTLTTMGKPTQIIQPYNFGEDASKATCLWLTGFPKLRNTSYYPPRIVDGKERWGNQTDSGQNKLTPSPDRAMLRSKTYAGIAKAIAEQFTNTENKQPNLFTLIK